MLLSVGVGGIPYTSSGIQLTINGNITLGQWNTGGGGTVVSAGARGLETLLGESAIHDKDDRFIAGLGQARSSSRNALECEWQQAFKAFGQEARGRSKIPLSRLLRRQQRVCLL